MYAGTKINLHEVLQKQRQITIADESIPLFLCVFSSDKGTEEITNFTKDDFVSMYGSTADFFKYGQPLIQAHAIVNAGGRILAKRIVADDANLANAVVFANVTQEAKDKTTADGKQLYIDEHGAETEEVTTTKATVNYAKIKYTISTIENVKNIDGVLDAANKAKTDTKFPLFVICENGRGKSIKKFRILPDYDVSKNTGFMIYSLQDIENNTVLENARFSAYPDGISNYSGTRRNLSLTESTSEQLKTRYDAEGLDEFVAKLAEITGYSKQAIYETDFLFGKTTRGRVLPGIEVDMESTDAVNLSSTYGIPLESGTNGAFPEQPFAGLVPSKEWTNAATKFLSGDTDSSIWDLDQYKIDYCCDANYPDEVKEKLSQLAMWRQDFFFFRDLGTDVRSLQDVREKIQKQFFVKSPFIGDYITCYDIIDKDSKKQIRVTMLHGLAPLLVKHYTTNVAAPIAGEFNSIVITEAIEGTMTFTPRVTPKINQKEILDELKLNYANYSSEGVLTVLSTYTSQDHNGPLSYSSNVIVTQMCVKDIRRYTPKIRFMLMDAAGDANVVDFNKYRELIVDNVITKYKKYFKSIDMVYTRDPEMISNKIFNASLYCYYKDFPQGEVFDVFAVEGSPDNTTSVATASINI